jgi:hypothetical protein
MLTTKKHVRAKLKYNLVSDFLQTVVNVFLLTFKKLKT